MEKIRLPEHWTKWELTKELGGGAYGKVYRAEAAEEINGFHAVSAVKIIKIPKDDTEASALYREYGSMLEVSRYYSNMVTDLVGEIQTLMALKGCRNILQIEDYHVERSLDNEYGWIIYIRMEYLQSFSEYLQNHEFHESDVIKLGIDLCHALEECEKVGIIHRDIKPDNILVSKDGDFKLGDFGVAKRLGVSNQSFSVKGTYYYMSPEVYYGRAYDHTADIYSLGLVLYRLLNHNRDPFVDVNKQIILYKEREKAMGKRMSGTPLPPPAYASPDMAAVILKACAYQIEDRYQSVAQMREDLEKIQKGTSAPVETSPVTEPDTADHKEEKGTVGDSISDTEINTTGKDKRRWTIAGIAVVLLAITLGAFGQKLINTNTGRAELIIDGESCSKDGKVVCTLDQKGTLTIKGTGPIEATDNNLTFPWDNFEEKDEIKKIIIEEGVTSIGDMAFHDLAYLSEVVLPDGLVAIGQYAFQGCENLSKIENITDALQEIGQNALADTIWLENQRDNKGYIIINGILINYNGSSKELDIPKEVHEISYGAFDGNHALRKVVLPDNLQTIRDSAFYDCSNLNEVVNLEGNTSIASIGMDTFDGTPWLNYRITRGGGYAVIDRRLFAYKGEDRAIQIPDDVEEILGCAFEDNDILEEITISPNVKYIGQQAFTGCTRLEKITFDQSSLERIEDETFRECISLSEINLPASVKTIGEMAFDECTSLRKIKLPKEIVLIEKGAFMGCGNLEEVEGADFLDKNMVEEAFAETWWYDNVFRK